MKLKNISLKWNLFLVILAFATLIVLVFCIFQIALLDNFYQSNKIDRTKEVIEEISNVAKKSTLEDFSNSSSDIYNYVENINLSDEGAIYVFSEPKDEITNTLKYNSYVGGTFKQLTPSFVNKIWSMAKATSYTQFYAILTVNPDPKFDNVQILSVDSPKKILTRDLVSKNDTIMCCSFVKLEDGNNYLIILDSKIIPVDAAVDTLKMQLTYITIIVVILSILIAILISKYISKPLSEMSKSAKQLAKGNYDVSFNAEGYLEVNELNQTLNNTAIELKKTETLRRELMANVSHDLKTPLTMITGYAEMMRDLPGENSKENLQIIIDEVNRLNFLVNDMLNLSRFTSKTVVLNLTNYSLTDNLIKIVDRYNKFQDNNQYEIELIYDGNVSVKADETKIEQVIYNFINNAISYSGNSKKITLKQEIIDKYVIVKVIDYGFGIKEDDLNYIWDRYFRIDKGHQRSTQGSGLGLSIVKSILEYHNFEYGVFSKIGEGSTFWFKMPIEK